MTTATVSLLLEEMGGPRLGAGAPTPWESERRVRDWIVWLIAETFHHGAEIGCLRDLYRAKIAHLALLHP